MTSTQETQTHFHSAANGAAARALQLADHIAACRDFQLITDDEIAALPLTKDGRPKGAHKIASGGFPVISDEAVRVAETNARMMRRYATLAGRFQLTDRQIGDMANMMRATLGFIRECAPEACAAFVPSVLEPHGHGRDLKTKANRASSDPQERIRHNERDVTDNNNKGNDYAADNARIGGRMSVEGIVSAALATAREDAA